MESQEDNKEIILSGIVLAIIMLLPHYILFTTLSLYRSLKGICQFFNENQWVFVLLVIVYPLGILSLVTCIGCILCFLPIFVLIDYYLLCIVYSKYPFIEGTRILFIEIFNENSDIFNFESDVEMTI